MLNIKTRSTFKYVLAGLFAASCSNDVLGQYQEAIGSVDQYGHPAVQEAIDPAVQNQWEFTAASAVEQQEESEPDEFADLKARLKTLEDAEAKRKKEADAKKAKEEKPLWTDMSKDKWNVRLGGHVQSDYIMWANADPEIPNAQNYFEFRRLRLLAEGTGYGNLDFRFQMTLEPETIGESPVGTVMSPDVKDAYLSMNDIPIIGRWRIGNFFVPYSLEQVTNDTFNIFLERSIPTQGIFAADREVGTAIYNCTDDQRLSWSSGIFLDSVSEGLKEKIDDNQGYRVSGRLVYLPYYDETTNGRFLWHTGAGVLYTEDSDNRVRFRARPQIHEGPRLIDSGVIAADDYTTLNLENAVVLGRFTCQTESFLSYVNQLNGQTPTVGGSYAHISYFVTGESRAYEKFGQHGAQFGRNVPFSNFFATPAGISWGALELKARWSHLDLSEVSAGVYNDMTFGFNWYWNERVRYMFDWIHPYTSAETTFGDVQADIIGMRFDFNW